MKIYSIFIIIFILLTKTANCQNTTSGFQKYRYYSNADSLEKVTKTLEKDPKKYLESLISLELSNFIFSDRFGEKIPLIETLAKQQNDKLALAMHHFIIGQYKTYEYASEAVKELNIALKYFEQTKDTTGMICCYRKLLTSNIDTFQNVFGSHEEAKKYYDLVCELGEKSNDPQNKYYYFYTKAANELYFSKNSTYAKNLSYINNCIALLKNNPNASYFFPLCYTLLGVVYSNNYEHEQALISLKKALPFFNEKKFSRQKSSVLVSIGFQYFSLKKYDLAKKYYQTMIDEFENNSNKSKVGVLMEYITAHNYLAQINQIQKNYKEAWLLHAKSDSLDNVYNENMNANQLLQLQSKYEFEKKESTIKNLTLEKEYAEKNFKWILGGFLLATILIGMMVFFIFRLRNANAKLLQLTQSRDKLFTIIAHDIRSPITTYQSLADAINFLIRTKQYDRIKDISLQIDKMSVHLSALINNLLQWSINEQKGIVNKPEWFDVKELIDKEIEVYKDIAQYRNIIIEEVFEQNSKIYSDYNSFASIFRNLIDNSIKNTQDNQKVFIHQKKYDDYLSIKISNPINEKFPMILPKIKELFSNKTTPNLGIHDFGLGLVLIKQFSDANNINIEVNNIDNKLVEFEMKIYNLE